jgi:hypothetical protein
MLYNGMKLVIQPKWYGLLSKSIHNNAHSLVAAHAVKTINNIKSDIPTSSKQS